MTSRRVVAFHEAGHAVARVCLGEPPTLTELRADGGGASVMNGTGHDIMMSSLHYILICLAGPYAQARATGQPISEVFVAGGHNDYMKAHDAAIIGTNGDEAEAKELSTTLAGHAEEFVREYWPQITNVGEELLRTSRIEPDQLLGIVGPFVPVRFA